MSGCPFVVSVGDVDPIYLCVASKIVNIRTLSHNIMKYKDDDTIYADPNATCDVCKENYKYIALGGSNVVTKICKC